MRHRRLLEEIPESKPKPNMAGDLTTKIKRYYKEKKGVLDVRSVEILSCECRSGANVKE